MMNSWWKRVMVPAAASMSVAVIMTGCSADVAVDPVSVPTATPSPSSVSAMSDDEVIEMYKKGLKRGHTLDLSNMQPAAVSENTDALSQFSRKDVAQAAQDAVIWHRTTALNPGLQGSVTTAQLQAVNNGLVTGEMNDWIKKCWDNRTEWVEAAATDPSLQRLRGYTVNAEKGRMGMDTPTKKDTDLYKYYPCWSVLSGLTTWSLFGGDPIPNTLTPTQPLPDNPLGAFPDKYTWDSWNAYTEPGSAPDTMFVSLDNVEWRFGVTAQHGYLFDDMDGLWERAKEEQQNTHATFWYYLTDESGKDAEDMKIEVSADIVLEMVRNVQPGKNSPDWLVNDAKVYRPSFSTPTEGYDFSSNTLERWEQSKTRE